MNEREFLSRHFAFIVHHSIFLLCAPLCAFVVNFLRLISLMMLNETHDAQLRSWVESANVENTDFPIQNLPFGVFKRKGAWGAPRVGVRIGDCVLHLARAVEEDLFAHDKAAQEAARACVSPTLNNLMALAPEKISALRLCLSRMLRADETEAARRAKSVAERILIAASEVEMFVPAEIGDYTDFYASIFHATNVGSLFRPDNPLLPNYKYVPIGYHGRASSIVESGAEIRRPVGQTRATNAPPDSPPVFEPCKFLDYELELGFFVAQGNRLGEPISINDAERHIFGAVLVNDWSARDIQAWEYQPLGPFLAKNFATTISPWVVTMEALAPFRAPAFRRAANDPAPLPYLFSEEDQAHGGLDIKLEVFISSQKMRDEGIAPVKLSASNTRDLYWTPAQMLAHHASNGCNLRAGDLLASGTVSGATKDSRGCLLELTWRGTEPLELPTGETRKFLADGDEIIFRAHCERESFARIGFGECRGIVLKANSAADERGRRG
jgi:fumarylacetoacetase